MLTWPRVEHLAMTAIQQNPEIRKGQALFNALYEIDPVTANFLRGTRYDCYYDDNLIEKFTDAVIKHWLYKEG